MKIVKPHGDWPGQETSTRVRRAWVFGQRDPLGRGRGRVALRGGPSGPDASFDRLQMSMGIVIDAIEGAGDASDDVRARMLLDVQARLELRA